MNRLPRRTVLAAGAAVPLAAIRTRPAGAAEFSYKYANNLPATHPLTLRAAEAAARIKQQTDGRVEINIFPFNQLGSDTDTLSQLRSGAVEFFTLSGLILSTLVPVASINGVGFAFKDYDQVWAAMDGGLGAYVRAEIDKRGLVAFERAWDNGYRQITSSTKPIRSPGDLNGFKIRVPLSPLWTSMFRAFGASPVSINFSETYSALQTHLADGQENPLAVIDTAKLYEVQKYLSVTNHMWDGFWFLANRRALAALPADAQEIVAARVQPLGAGAARRRGEAQRVAGRGAEAEGDGLRRHRPGRFRAALKKAGFYAEWQEKYGEDAWGVWKAWSAAWPDAESARRPRRPRRRARVETALRRAVGMPRRRWWWRRSACCWPAWSAASCSTTRSSGPTNWPPSCSCGWPCSARWWRCSAAEHMRLTAVVAAAAAGVAGARRGAGGRGAGAVPADPAALGARSTRRMSGSSRRRRWGCRTSCAPPPCRWGSADGCHLRLRLLRCRRPMCWPWPRALAVLAGGLWLGAPALRAIGNWNLLFFFVSCWRPACCSACRSAFAFGAATLAFLACATHVPLTIVVSRMDEGMSSLVLLAVPLFVFLGLLIEMTGMARAMVAFLAALLGHVRGGLYYVLLGAIYLVSGISGSKAADMAAVAPVLFPGDEAARQPEGELVAMLAASGAMSETIPPSLVLITIGSVTGVSIAALFTGGLLPGAGAGGRAGAGGVAALARRDGGARARRWREVGRALRGRAAGAAAAVLIRAAVVARRGDGDRGLHHRHRLCAVAGCSGCWSTRQLPTGGGSIRCCWRRRRCRARSC